MKPDQVIAKQEELSAVKALRANPAFKELEAELISLRDRHQEAHEDITKTPHERAEHIHALRMARELCKWAANKEARLTDILRKGIKSN